MPEDIEHAIFKELEEAEREHQERISAIRAKLPQRGMPYLTFDQASIVMPIVQSGNLLSAIKVLRNSSTTRIGLKEAKDWIFLLAGRV